MSWWRGLPPLLDTPPLDTPVPPKPPVVYAPPAPEPPPYSGDDGSCVKCGTRDLSSEYVYQWRDTTSTVLIGRHRGMYTVRGEHLKRTCKGCGFAWPERCADAEEGT